MSVGPSKGGIIRRLRVRLVEDEVLAGMDEVWKKRFLGKSPKAYRKCR